MEALEVGNRRINEFRKDVNRIHKMCIRDRDNTFKVNKNLSFELIGNVQTPVIQGTFDIESIFNLTAGLKWNFANDKLSLSARCNDIFDTCLLYTSRCV